MFDHLHYVPILKGKRGEFPAIGALRSKILLTPLFEHVPSQQPDFIPRKMDDIWSKDDPYFVDMLFVDDEDAAEGSASTHPLALCFNSIADKHQFGIPVTGPTRSPAYQAALRAIVASQGRGFAIRLLTDDFDDEDAVAEWVDAIIDYTGIESSSIDMIVDLGTVAGQTAAVIARTHRTLLSLLPRITEWRTLTVVSGAFPTSLSPLTRGIWNPISRNDWHAWFSLIERPRGLARLPSYGDYAIAHPDLPPEGRATILAQLRYSTPSDFLIFKGENVFTHLRGFAQFCDICADMVTKPEYRGAAFSEGDRQIAEKATKSGSCGNAETWRIIGVNHHVETVLDQIATVPSP